MIWGKERGCGSAGDTMGKRVGGGGVEWAESEEEDKGDLMLVRGREEERLLLRGAWRRMSVSELGEPTLLGLLLEGGHSPLGVSYPNWPSEIMGVVAIRVPSCSMYTNFCSGFKVGVDTGMWVGSARLLPSLGDCCSVCIVAIKGVWFCIIVPGGGIPLGLCGRMVNIPPAPPT